MVPAPHSRIPGKYFFLGVAAACLAVGGWWARKYATVEFPVPRTEANAPSSGSKSLSREDLEPQSAQELAAGWLSRLGAAKPSHVHAEAITITSLDSPERRAAFQELLQGVAHDNVADLHDILGGEEGNAGFNDDEWKAFLGKWGRLDGAAALAHLGEDPSLVSRIPGVLHGWASVNPQEATAWLQKHAPSEAFWRNAAQRELILGWLEQGFERPAQWFRDHPEDPAFDETLAAFATAAASSDPSGAFAWAASVEGNWRRFAMERVAREWLAQDRATATQALQKAGYSADEITVFSTPEEGIDLTKPAKKKASLAEESDAIHIGE